MPHTPPGSPRNKRKGNRPGSKQDTPPTTTTNTPALPPINQSGGGVMRAQTPPTSTHSASPPPGTGTGTTGSPIIPTPPNTQRPPSARAPRRLPGIELPSGHDTSLGSDGSSTSGQPQGEPPVEIPDKGVTETLNQKLGYAKQLNESWASLKKTGFEQEAQRVLDLRTQISEAAEAINTRRQKLGDIHIGGALNKYRIRDLRALAIEAEEAVKALKKKRQAGKASSSATTTKIESDLERLKILLKARRKRANGEADDTVYKEWLSKAGLELGANASEEDVLAHFGRNWFKLKDTLAFKVGKGAEGGESATDYRIKLGAMDQLLRFRQEKVDALLKETKKAIADRYRAQGITEDDIEASAVGSVTPTSDYDITFIIKKRPDLEVECVDHFNKTFLDRFKVSSGALFDTNVYTNGFMTMDAEGRKYIDKFRPDILGDTELSPAEEQIVQEGKLAKHRTQMALSYLAIRQAVSPEDWDKFKRETVALVSKQLAELPERAKDVELARQDLATIFKEAEALHQETVTAIEKEKATVLAHKKATWNGMGITQPADVTLHLEGESKDALYVKSLKGAAERLNRIRALHEELKPPIEPATRRSKLQELKEKIVEFEKEQGKALVYANEAYFSGGAAVHVVKGMQAGGGVELGRQMRMQSLLMNIGYKINHFNHLDGNLPRAFLNTAKYGQRISHALEKETGKGGNLRHGLSMEARTMLVADKFLISDVKKDNVTLPTPTKKETETAAILDGLKLRDTREVQSPYLEIAKNAVALVYADKPGVWSIRPAAPAAPPAEQGDQTTTSIDTE